MAVMKNSYSEPCILFYKVRDNTPFFIITEKNFSGKEFYQKTRKIKSNGLYILKKTPQKKKTPKEPLLHTSLSTSMCS